MDLFLLNMRFFADNFTLFKTSKKMNHPTYIIRKAVEMDMLTVYEQICILEGMRLNRNDFIKIYFTNIQNQNILYYLAETKEGKCVGFISCHIEFLLHHCGKVAEIQELVVDEAYRSLGIGALLLQQIENEIISRHCVLLEVTTRKTRLRAHQFYEKNGFSPSHFKFTKTPSKNL